jgi:diaminopimelate decarboxylase
LVEVGEDVEVQLCRESGENVFGRQWVLLSYEVINFKANAQRVWKLDAVMIAFLLRFVWGSKEFIASAEYFSDSL